MRKLHILQSAIILLALYILLSIPSLSLAETPSEVLLGSPIWYNGTEVHVNGHTTTPRRTESTVSKPVLKNYKVNNRDWFIDAKSRALFTVALYRELESYAYSESPFDISSHVYDFADELTNSVIFTKKDYSAIAVFMHADSKPISPGRFTLERTVYLFYVNSNSSSYIIINRAEKKWKESVATVFNRYNNSSKYYCYMNSAEDIEYIKSNFDEYSNQFIAEHPMTEVIASGGKYKLNEQQNAAIFYGPSNTKVGNLEILDKVKIGDKTYEVKEIAASACKGLKLSSVSIGKNVEKIGTNAFRDCYKLKVITVKTKKLSDSTIGDNAFKKINKNVVFKCPKGLLETYKTLFVKKGAPKTSTFIK